MPLRFYLAQPAAPGALLTGAVVSSGGGSLPAHFRIACGLG
jgi:hypothetical protein